MRVLMIVASKHGGTMEIGEALAAELRARGMTVEVHPIDEVVSLEGHDAVILGSAIYLGQWMKEATLFVERHIAALRSLPVWLFSSGPLGDPPVPVDDSPEADRLTSSVAARGRRTFGGRLDMDKLGPGDHTVAMMLHAPSGDFRRWDEIGAWAEEIAAGLNLRRLVGDSSAGSAMPRPESQPTRRC